MACFHIPLWMQCIPITTRHLFFCTNLPVLLQYSITSVINYIPDKNAQHLFFSFWLPTAFSILAARSPLFSHIATTLTGLPTIRSLKRQQMSLEWYHALQDDHTTGWNSYIASTRWFGLRVDAIGALFVGIVAFMAIPLADSEYLKWFCKTGHVVEFEQFRLEYYPGVFMAATPNPIPPPHSAY